MQNEAKIAAVIYRMCIENNVKLSPRLNELVHLLQMPLVAQSMLVRLMEVKRIFSTEIDAFFKVSKK